MTENSAVPFSRAALFFCLIISLSLQYLVWERAVHPPGELPVFCFLRLFSSSVISVLPVMFRLVVIHFLI